MTYTIEHLARRLRDVRKAQGMSQRTLSAKAGIPQSHISKIESGAVDLRVSSLVEIARVLNLELELVPRNSVSAVRAIARRTKQNAPDQFQSAMHDAGRARPAYSLDAEEDG